MRAAVEQIRAGKIAAACVGVCDISYKSKIPEFENYQLFIIRGVSLSP